MLQIWNNHFVSKRKLLYQVLVDGILWELDELGNYQAILLVDDVVFDERQLPYVTGRELETSEGIH